MQRDSISIRLPIEDPGGRTEWVNFLRFQDGSAKGFAGFLVWFILCQIVTVGDPALLDTPEACTLVKSLASINTVLDEQPAGASAADGAILAIARQNQAARVTPVTSYQWSCILLRMGENLTFEQAGGIDDNADFDTSLTRLGVRFFVKRPVAGNKILITAPPPTTPPPFHSFGPFGPPLPPPPATALAQSGARRPCPSTITTLRSRRL